MNVHELDHVVYKVLKELEGFILRVPFYIAAEATHLKKVLI